MKYNYCQKNLIEEPEYYMYSKYGGKNFLVNFINFRQQIIDKIPIKKDLTNITNIKIFLKEYNFKFSLNKCVDFLNNYKKNSEKEIKLLELLKFFIFCIINSKDEFNYNIDKILSSLAKSYEIKKRIFSAYNSKLKKTTQNYSNKGDYIMLSLLSLLFYEKNKNLKFLNLALKLNDIFCSIYEDIDDNMIEIGALNLIFENILIAELIKEKGINL